MTDNEEYFKSEGFQNLLKQYEASVNSGQPIYMDADDLADIADYYQFNGRMNEADAAISLALEYNPDAVGPLLYKAREALSKNDYDTARAYADKMMKRWDVLAKYLIVKYNDQVVRKVDKDGNFQRWGYDTPGYDIQFINSIGTATGDRYRLKEVIERRER